ncbi:hypothetical protein GGR54DRAFT_618022 [Hypoxylon sp. NC1633]|nr:hypothetical protein GGR54DRAFT_618022 [Hypoxylon sp. NC1633]
MAPPSSGQKSRAQSENALQASLSQPNTARHGPAQLSITHQNDTEQRMAHPSAGQGSTFDHLHQPSITSFTQAQATIPQPNVPLPISQPSSPQQIYDLDRLPFSSFYVLNFMSSQGVAKCCFRALPLRNLGIPFRNLSEYGQVIQESPDKLVMKINHENPQMLLSVIKQAWVTKYATTGEACSMTFETMLPYRPTVITIERCPAVGHTQPPPFTPQWPLQQRQQQQNQAAQQIGPSEVQKGEFKKRQQSHTVSNASYRTRRLVSSPDHGFASRLDNIPEEDEPDESTIHPRRVYARARGNQPIQYHQPSADFFGEINNHFVQYGVQFPAAYSDFQYKATPFNSTGLQQTTPTTVYIQNQIAPIMYHGDPRCQAHLCQPGHVDGLAYQVNQFYGHYTGVNYNIGNWNSHGWNTGQHHQAEQVRGGHQGRGCDYQGRGSHQDRGGHQGRGSYKSRGGHNGQGRDHWRGGSQARGSYLSPGDYRGRRDRRDRRDRQGDQRNEDNRVSGEQSSFSRQSRE